MVEPEDYTVYSDKELQQLKEIHFQTIKHYETLLDLQHLSEDTRFEIQKCLEYTKKDLEVLEAEILLRSKK